MNHLTIKLTVNNLSLLHLNIASLQKHKEELETILNLIDFKFDVLGITESKIRTNREPITNINMEGYQIYSTPTEAEKGGAPDHMAQFLIIPEENHKIPKNITLYKRDLKIFHKENFTLDLLSVDWEETLDLAKKDPNISFNRFEASINPLIDKYLPLKKYIKKRSKK